MVFNIWKIRFHSQDDCVRAAAKLISDTFSIVRGVWRPLRSVPSGTLHSSMQTKEFDVNIKGCWSCLQRDKFPWHTIMLHVKTSLCMTLYFTVQGVPQLRSQNVSGCDHQPEATLSVSPSHVSLTRRYD